MHFTIRRGVSSLLGQQERQDNVQFTLRGDLHQMSEQKRFLSQCGLKIGQAGVYPGFFSEEDYERGLKIIWENKVPGWWHYEDEYVARGICTSEDFQRAQDSL